ncbi:MAG: DNA-directed RNA polymerase subunit beta' [candidate division CPR2 bacterium GW2011_GWC1_39_9]|nr:MAG: DNA-directed RNA polymerase subunit beta' [candidate division CPR2 bacterium GW2011_GWC1_39_9]
MDKAVFDAVRLAIASPEEILDWSHGEVTKPETINYRTQKPEKDGLFCERIFGPTKDWECYCGKYKRIRYKGIICDKCGVEVTRSIVRRERLGHIKLAVPVTHIWFLRGVPSSIGTALDIGVKDLEKIVYFASYVITSVNDEAKYRALASLEEEFKSKKEELAKTAEEKTEDLLSAQGTNLQSIRDNAKSDLESIAPGQLLNELKYRELAMKHGEVFTAGMGAEAILELLKGIDLEKIVTDLKEEVDNTQGQRKKKALRRLKLLEGMQAAVIKPEWMIMSVLPVIPPDLRPMVQLDGGRFATSDLNDLYRRVINRNNRLRKLIEMDAPDIICRNEKRMLQEAVDALIDNSARREKAVASSGARRKLRSLADMLKGKQGRFRQNLLGKRVDYSGRSVIVCGPELRLQQCGIPKMMALELFKPFVISRLIAEGYAHNVKSASRMIEKSRTEVWDGLEEVIKEKHVLLNRAPTLHRLGIQAFQPVLIEGKAIKIHPLVTSAFNADFDGDQMAIHVPLSRAAQEEARNIMLSSNNLLKPAAGEPIVMPTKDMVMGCYYLTIERPDQIGTGRSFSTLDEVIMAYELEQVTLNANIKVKFDGTVYDTTVGRVIFNKILPRELQFSNEALDSKKLGKIVARSYKELGREATAKLVDDIKDLGFEYATISGLSMAVADIETPPRKKEILDEAENKIIEIDKQFARGLITEKEKYEKAVELWEKVKDQIQDDIKANLNPYTSISMMVSSGARGKVEQLTQMAGMKGSVVSPTGAIIELPVRSNYKEGLTVLEYFISTHGARKGLSDVALRTSDSGYLTRRLVDVAQDVIITENDCKDKTGITVSKNDTKAIGESFAERIQGRVVTKKVVDPETGEVLVKENQLISEEVAKEIENSKIDKIDIRSVLTCKIKWGVCQMCYGTNLATAELVKLGDAVGIMAAQSIGEPGTQLTMRTFHTGGVVGLDITQGLPRVEELFEVRNPKGEAVLAELEGKVLIKEGEHRKTIRIISDAIEEDSFNIKDMTVEVKSGDRVTPTTVLFTKNGKKPVKAKNAGSVRIDGDKLYVAKDAEAKEYEVPLQTTMKVEDGEKVEKGQPLTEGSWNLQTVLKLLGERAVQEYVIAEVKQIYASQGQSINDRHIEIIVKQMFSRYQVEDGGDTSLTSGQIVSKYMFEKENEAAKNAGGKEADAQKLLLSITKVSLSTDSFLSAASFQETSRILIDAATRGKIDELRGLKENVIIGKLIPVGTGFRHKKY